ncbi:sigma factor-like helix-turn-helix DNA-binding protein [Actinomyces faecalis]|nr:sigma factor-like helix-turn-helix DNA-binding protein [Actinomyces faecalis]
MTDLLAQGLTMQDVATLMGITKGRVSQIAKAA